MTQNEQYWIDRANRRMDGYQISAIKQAKIINKSYNQTCNYVQSEIAKILRHIGDEGTLAYEYRMKRLTALLENTNKRMQELYGVTLNDTTSFLRNIIPEAYYHTIFDIAQGIGEQPVFSAVNTRLINQIVNDQWSGKNYSQRIWWNTSKLSEDVQQLLTTAAMTGESIYKTSRRLSERFGESMNNSVRLIRTETTYSCNQAELASYSALDIDRYKFTATLDTRTSSICQELDGKVFETKDAKAGVNLPAMHPNCRSTTIAYFDEGMPDIRIAKDKDGNRIRVPADMTYKDWYKKYIENGAQSAQTSARGNNTPKPSGKPQRTPESTPATVDIPALTANEPEYKDTPIPQKINNQSIDNSANRGIIEEKEELPRKPKNGVHPVDWNAVQTEEYSDKFGKLSENEKVSAAIETRAKWALNNRDGKKSEELYAISLKDGHEIARITDQDYDYAVKRTPDFTQKLNAADKTGEEILLLHNHPRGLPPGLSDINALTNNVNVSGITVGHNGSIYRYTRPETEIPESEWLIALKRYKKYSDITSMEKALVDLSKQYNFVFEIL